MSEKPISKFAKIAADEPNSGLIRELWAFSKHTKKWWLLPIILVLLLFGLMTLLSSTAAAPFIYTLF